MTLQRMQNAHYVTSLYRILTCVYLHSATLGRPKIMHAQWILLVPDHECCVIKLVYINYYTGYSNFSLGYG